MTALELIRGAMRLTGALGMGRGIGASVQADALVTLNAMLAGWNNQRLLIYQIAENAYTWPASAASRTIGPATANFTAPRPQRIETAVIVDGDDRHGLAILTPRQWAEIGSRSMETTLPEAIYDNGASPNSTLYLWPVPSVELQLELGTWLALSAIPTVATAFTLPDGYERALMYNLALELAPQLPDANVSQLVADTARESKAEIKRLNTPLLEMSCDSALLPLSGWADYDILTGDYRR